MPSSRKRVDSSEWRVPFSGLVTLVLFYDRRRINLRSLGAAFFPYAVLGLIWASYIFQDYPAFIDQMRGNGTNGRWPRR